MILKSMINSINLCYNLGVYYIFFYSVFHSITFALYNLYNTYIKKID